jgi:hypothetical protein
MQQFDKQVRSRYTNLFAKGQPLNGIPTIYQRRGFISKSFEQIENILKGITENDFQKISYIQSMSVASVYKIMNDFLINKKTK